MEWTSFLIHLAPQIDLYLLLPSLSGSYASGSDLFAAIESPDYETGTYLFGRPSLSNSPHIQSVIFWPAMSGKDLSAFDKSTILVHLSEDICKGSTLPGSLTPCRSNCIIDKEY